MRIEKYLTPITFTGYTIYIHYMLSSERMKIPPFTFTFPFRSFDFFKRPPLTFPFEFMLPSLEDADCSMNQYFYTFLECPCHEYYKMFKAEIEMFFNFVWTGLNRQTKP